MSFGMEQNTPALKSINSEQVQNIPKILIGGADPENLSDSSFNIVDFIVSFTFLTLIFAFILPPKSIYTAFFTMIFH